MSMDCVKLKFVDPEKSQKKNKNETLLYWPASQIPSDAKFSIETAPKTNKTTITAESHVNFSSSETCDDEVNYFIATRDPNGKLICHQTQMFRMFPNYGFKDVATENNKIGDANRLSKREQLDELKEKFGSRKSQRDLASKRKYEIQFGEDDIDNLPSIKPNLNDTNEGNCTEETVDSEPKALSAILPPRDDNAKAVEDVYCLRDIITEAEEASMKDFEEQLSTAMKNEYIKSLFSKFEDQQQMRLVAIYADLLLQLVKLSAYEMRKADPLPLVESELKKFLFDRYTSTMQPSATSRSIRCVITDQNKDRIYVYVFLLILMLNRYKPIELEKLQTNCKLPMNNIRRMLELIGCYVENMRNSSGVSVKVARLKLPLNVYKEPKKKFRR